MKIRFRKASVEEWQDAASRCAWATWFHTPEWYKLWCEYANYPFAVDAFELADGRKAIFPYLFTTELRGLTKFRFTPAGTYGGLISANVFSEEETEAIRHAYEKHYNNLRIREFPLSPFSRNLTDIKTELTYLLPINQPMKEILSGWRRGHQRNIRRMEERKVVMQEARSLEEWKLYFEAYQQTFQHWRLPESDYDWHLFHLLYQQRSSRIKLWLLKQDEQIITGSICFYNNKIAEGWHQSTFDKFRSWRPNDYLQYLLIKEAKQAGFTWYDLGPSGYKENVALWKRGFAPQVLPSNLYIRTPKWLAAYQHVRKSMGI